MVFHIPGPLQPRKITLATNASSTLSNFHWTQLLLARFLCIPLHCTLFLNVVQVSDPTISLYSIWRTEDKEEISLFFFSLSFFKFFFRTRLFFSLFSKIEDFGKFYSKFKNSKKFLKFLESLISKSNLNSFFFKSFHKIYLILYVKILKNFLPIIKNRRFIFSKNLISSNNYLDGIMITTTSWSRWFYERIKREKF